MIDLSGVEATKGFTVLPVGTYLLKTVNAEIKTTSAGTGEYIKLELGVLKPVALENRRLWVNFNIKNPNPTAVEIGLGQLKGFMVEAGIKDVASLADVNKLVGLTVGAKVTVRNDATYGESNEIKAFLAAALVTDAVAGTGAVAPVAGEVPAAGPAPF